MGCIVEGRTEHGKGLVNFSPDDGVRGGGVRQRSDRLSAVPPTIMITISG